MTGSQERTGETRPFANRSERQGDERGPSSDKPLPFTLAK